ncbi:cyclic nucleotide-binding/CBS domain-containing protein [Aurantiacibacter aquimixticola]|uniref:CBS domain-containing protein n=1 Tax=Aurantiacibacter aquimixticola TaxID=1958945 RepID=A0A419RX65_9SPHN|nr:CBS domain-containing protein [Aurantiacibacter aquimixticola]RJY10390.1 CBS domain-containing protein [Aurantiacibacter aquimixticola]
MQIKDRKEFASKGPPLTCSADTTVYDAVTRMSEKNFGSIVIVDGENKVHGMMTERDIFRRVIAEDRNPKTTPVSEVMTTQLRMAKADDELVDWLRIMSNERFRRLPIVDEENRLQAIMSQGDFVSYTWPQLLQQAARMAQASMAPSLNPAAILAAVLVYTLILVVAVALVV